MTSRLLPCLAAAVLCGCWVVAADSVRTAEDVQDVVLLGDKRPLLLRLHLFIDGQPFRVAHRTVTDDYVAALFNYLDANGDGFLSEAEARRMPVPFRLPREAGTGSVNVAFNYRVVDADGDGRISRTELADFLRDFAGGPVQVQPAFRTPIPAAVNQKLFDLLDTNNDGKLSREELAAAATTLFKFDLDRDELLTPEELAQDGLTSAIVGLEQQARLGMRNPLQGSSPALVVVSTGDDRSGLAAGLLTRYGRGNKKLSRESLGLDAEAFDRLDTNRDGVLDARELERFADRAADAELIVRLGKRPTGQAALEVFRPDDRRASAALRPSGDGTLLLTFGGAHVELRVNDGRPAQLPGTRQRYLDMFRTAAGVKDHLTRKDVQLSQFFPNLFPLLDQDGDGKLTERELAAYLDEVQERQAALVAATPALLLSDRGTGLFELLDRDRDGRLSLRELRGAPALLARLGREAEGSLSREDLSGSYQLAIGLGLASFSRAGPGAFTPREMPMLTMDWARPDLIWFYKMDRNRDGDISPREWLGSHEAFRQIDADGDGLISLEEAKRAEKLFRK